MSIFKESFRDYVKKQFGVRQAVISRGNSDKRGLGPTSRMQPLPADPKRGIPKIQAGAFFSYNQKQCVIRLSSMVDLMEDIGLDLGGSTFESYKGETFARNFILEGGVLSDYARNNANGEQVTRKVTEVRGGFPSSKKKVNLSYGDPSIASDPRGGSDGYGAVPKPGIVDANVRTKSAYGSLREAKVNFVCHNLRQLEILELLYMRPGYPVLMEWGWSPFINNEGNVVNTFDSMSDNDWFWDDGSKEMNQNFIQREIIKRKKSFNGNYDGFIGFVTNFSYTARPDGGFNCTTELISMGEVLDSLKIPGINFSSYNTDDNDELKEQKLYQSTLGRLLKDLNNVIDEAKIQRKAQYEDYKTSGGSVKDGARINSKQINKDTGLRTETNLSQTLQEINTSNENLNKALKGSISDFIIQKDQVIVDSTQSEESETSKIQTKEGFVRWDGLAALINNYVIPTNEKGHKPITIETTIVPSDIDTESDPDPLLYCSYEDINNQIMDVSCDAKTCILPHQFSQFENDEISLTLSGRIKRFWSSGWDFKGIKEAFTAESAPDNNSLEDYTISEEISKRRIGSIFIGIDFLNDVFKSTFLNNKDATLGDFLKNIWKKINEQCPMHNFVLRVDQEYTNAIQVIDLPISTNDLKKLNYDDLFEFNVHSNDTIVREFKYDTQIPDALKATIAINAQSGATADDLDSVTFAAFNRSIKSRLSSLSEKFSENEAKNYRRLYKLKVTKKRRLNELKDEIFKYNKAFFNLIDKKEDDDLESIYGNIKAIIKEAQSLELYLEQSTSGYLKNQAIIPINLTLSIDGISGIVIGNVFRVDPSRLPRAYRQRRVGFVALGEDQNITSGQDWTTNIRGQLILFPSNEEIINKGKKRNNEVKVDPKAAALNETQQNSTSIVTIVPTSNSTTPGEGAFTLRVENPINNPLAFEPSSNFFTNENGATDEAIIPNRVIGGAIGSEIYEFQISNVSFNQEMGVIPVKELLLNVPLVTYITFSENQIILSTADINVSVADPTRSTLTPQGATIGAPTTGNYKEGSSITIDLGGSITTVLDTTGTKSNILP